YLFHQKEFAHRDIVYVYAPIRSWFAEQLRHGIFPFWDPFMGLGRLADAWTTIPVDLLSLLEVPLSLTYRQVYALQIIIIFVTLRLLFRRFQFSPLQTHWLTFLYILAPTTGYFLRYYVKGWAFLLYAFLFTHLYFFVQDRSRKHLYWISGTTLLLTLGCKFEYVFTLMATIFPAYAVYALWTAPRGQKVRTVLVGQLAILSPLLINYWNFSLITDAAKSTLRLVNDPLNLSDFGHSLLHGMIDSHTFALLALVVAVLFTEKVLNPTLDKVGFFLSVALLIFFASSHPKSGYAFGILAALALHTWFTRPADLRQKVILLAKAALLFFYFTRAIPGDADETRIIQWAGSGVLFTLGFFASLGFFSRPLTGLMRWCSVVIGTVLFYRGIGLVFLNYLQGILWIPARDNFLIELPLALFSIYGWQALYGILTGPFSQNRTSATNNAAAAPLLIPHQDARARRFDRFIPTAAVLATLAFLLNHPFLDKPIKNKVDPIHGIFNFEWLPEQASDVYQRETLDWKKGFEYEPFGHTRILSYFHTYGRFQNIADTYEYQSLVSGRFAHYSIASRLGIPYEDATHLAATTGALTKRFVDLVKPLPTVDILENNPRLHEVFYMFYILTAAPKLDCNHMRLMGIRYVEGDQNSYYHPNAGVMNGLFSLLPTFEDATMNSDVADAINVCGFPKTKIGDREFWVVDHPMPRAFFLPGIKAEDLAKLKPDDVKFQKASTADSHASSPESPSGPASGGTLTIAGREIAWLPVSITKYEPNHVTLNLNASEPGTVVLTDLFHTRWSATRNGEPTEIQPAFFLFRGINVETGVNELNYSIGVPSVAKNGLCLVLGILGMIGALALNRPKDDTEKQKG
ncbi:MAG: hypothetical protein AB7F86_10620, partial [Bdellovibrionales bacterium]